MGGRLLRRYVGRRTYRGTQQNWDATQDSSGVLYVANTEGVLTYDGHAWGSISTGRGVSTVTSDAAGRVYVGRRGDFGVIQTDSLGRRTYESLTDQLSAEHRSFREVKAAVTTNERVFFQTKQRLFRWTPATDSMKVWHIKGGRFQRADVVRGTVYVNVTGEGLMAVRDGRLQRVPGGERFADRSVHFLFPHGEEGMLLVTYRDGLFRYDGSSFRPFSTGADDILEKAWLYVGTHLRDGTLAIGMIDHGLLLLAPDGSVRRHLSARDNPVTGLYADREGGLWALLDGGMIRYSVGAPFTEYGEAMGLEGITIDLARHGDALYAATNQGTYRVEGRAGAPGTLSRLSGLQLETGRTSSWDLESVGNDLFVATVYGLARRGPDDAVEYLYENTQTFSVRQSRTDSTRLYVGTHVGLRAVERTRTGWTDGGQLLELGTQVRALAQANDGPLWLGTQGKGLYRVRGTGPDDSLSMTHFGAEAGLPDGPVEPYRDQGRVVFGTSGGVFRYSSSTSSFVRDSTIEMPPVQVGNGRLRVRTDAQGRMWGTAGRAGGWRRADSTWRWAPGRLSRLHMNRARTLAPADSGHAVWFGMWGDRVVRYVPESGWARDDISPRIHEVFSTDTDTLVGGQGASTTPYAEGGVRVTYGTPSLVAPERVKYQYKMTGVRAEWSDWTGRTEQTFRNLPPGPHTFAVRARLAYGDTTRAARYTVTVLPPWYRTWGAYGLYLLLAVGLVVGAVQWRTRHLRRRQERLRQTVAERTEEIEHQKEQLAEQAERLKELDDAKSRFFANVSHEFRTPLTLILGSVQDLRDRVRRHLSEADAEQLGIIEQNAQRLLRLVDQILGIARMDAGTYRLDARPLDLHTEVARIARTFEPLAEREGLDMTVEADADAPPPDAAAPYVDREALEHVVGNLLSNAIKFTPEGGTITVSVAAEADAVALTVADTGPGIPAAEREAIFDRFAQAGAMSDSGMRAEEGAGIGLAFVQDLVDLHGGTISVQSEEGDGATFTVRFQRGCSHLPDEHRAEPEAPAPDATPENASLPGEPARAPDDAADEPTASEAPAPTGDGAADPDAPLPAVASQKRILVVEDNTDVRQYVRSILTPAFEVVEARNGREGLEKAREALPDVILADVMMPEMDGHEMTRRLKADPETKAIPVIMVTARAGTGDEVEGLKVGANDYITKPFDATVLRQRVSGVVVLQERLRERLRAEEALPEDSPAEADATDARRSEVEQEARRVIREHLAEPDFDASALASAMAMSRSSLYRTFGDETDTTPSALITEVRMERAKDLLRNGEGTVTQVAYAVGFDQLSSFSRAFREYAGHPPSAVAA
jgi:signal transduction histidine kinase/DNA-binding response OmpR family regulator/ligand-binding sensor domain-containing protein